LKLDRIGFGGGCHWCTEAVFQALRGVKSVDQGFVKSDPPYDTFSEAVLVEFDPATIPLGVLIEVHLRTHASTSNHKMRGKYRSAIYVFGGVQEKNSSVILNQLRGDFEKKLVTNVLNMGEFEHSSERFKNYYASGPEKPFCQTYIDPKLSLLRADYASYLDA